MSSPSPLFGSLRLKLWLRRLSISAPTMRVRSQMPWPFKLIFLVVVFGLGGALAMWMYDLGRSLTGFNPAATQEKMAVYREQIDKLQTERDALSTMVNASESQRTMEQAAQKQLMSQVKALETENLKLKEDLAFFESLLPADTGPQGISIRRLKAELIAPNQLRYRLLIMQGGKGERDFMGNLQLVVTVMRDGKGAMMTFPDSHDSNTGQYKLDFKHYQRMEGVLTLPGGVIIKAVQARVLDKGQVRAQQSVNL